jgi:hypothetical protein
VNIYEQSRYVDIAAGIAGIDLDWREKLALIGSEFLKQPQIECPVSHEFSGGEYVRIMRIPRGTLFIGRQHKKGHRCVLRAGSCVQFLPDGKIERNPGDSVQSWPGYQVVLYAITDVIGATHHPDSGERDIDKLEAEIFEPKEAFTELGMKVQQMLKDHV